MGFVLNSMIIAIWTTLAFSAVPVKAATTVKSVDDDFQYKTVIVGVAISTSNMTDIPNIVSMESTFRNLIMKTLSNAEKLNEQNSTMTSNVTVVTISLESDFDLIPEISVLVTLAECFETYDFNEKLTARYKEIVHLAITNAGCPRLNPATAITIPLALFRHRDEVLQLIVDMRQRNVLPKWKSVTVIHDQVSGEEILTSVLDSFKSRRGLEDVATGIFTVDSGSRLKSFERQMEDVFQSYKRRQGNFLVITPVANIESTLALAKRMNLLKHTMQWLFLAPDSADRSYKRWSYVTERIIADGVHLAFVSNRTEGIGSYDQILCSIEQMLDLLTETVENLAGEELKDYLQVSDEEWELIKPTREQRVLKIIANMTENMDGIIQDVCVNTYMPLWKLEAAEHGFHGKRVFEIGNWQTFKGLQLQDDLFPHVVGAFRGRTIRVTSMHFPPWQIFSRNATTGKMIYSGLIFEILDYMGSTLNFSYEVIQPKNGETWGVEKFDGTWNGMMKQVIDEEVILGAAAFTIRPEKSKVVNFTMVLEREAYTFMVNRPSQLSRVLLFAEPFSEEVWLCIGFSILIVAPIFYLIHRHSAFYTNQEKNAKRGLFQLKNCFLYLYGALLQQGGSQLPEALSGRMLIGFWWLFVLVTVTTYSGNLVAFLTFPRVEVAVNSIRDLISYKGVSSWGFLASSVIETYLQSSNDTDYGKLYRHAIKHPTLNQTILNRVRYGNHAYIDWKIALMVIMKEQYLLTGKCEYVLGKEEIFEEQIALIVPRSSPYLNMFNQEIKWMLQSGLIIKWKGKYWPKKDKCSSLIAAAANRTVKIGDMQGSFYLLMLGFLLASIVLLTEYFIFRRHQSRVSDSIKIFVTNAKSKEIWQQKQFPFLH